MADGSLSPRLSRHWASNGGILSCVASRPDSSGCDGASDQRNFIADYGLGGTPGPVRFSRSATITDSTMAIKMMAATIINETPVGISI